MKKTNSSDVDFVETTVQNLSHFPQYITVFITRVTGLPLFTERELVIRKRGNSALTVLVH